MITDEQDDMIHNAMMAGMAFEDAVIIANLTPEQIATVDESKYRHIAKEYEYSLLRSLNQIIDHQRAVGKEAAVTWALEHMFPRYTNKQEAAGQPININFSNAQLADVDYDC